MKQNQFDLIAESYEKFIPQHIVLHYLNKRASFIKRLIKQGLVLDVGCGTGLLVNKLEHLGFTVAGLDSSAGMLKQMKRMKRSNPICGTSESLPFKSDSFDLVLSIAALHHIGDKERITQSFLEMVRVAKPGAKILIWDHNPNNPYWPIFMKRLPWDDGVKRLIPLKEILEDFKKMGVKRVEVYRKGFVPDFIPRILLPIAGLFELILEGMPIIRNFAAHNVIVVEKCFRRRTACAKD